MALPPPRKGNKVEIKKREIPFGFWPMRRTTRRFGLHTISFSDDPWDLLQHAVRARCPAAAKPSALAFLSQAQDFYRAATFGGIAAAKPLLIYYCFLNLVKAYILTIGQLPSLDRAKHGLSERLRAGNRELLDAFLQAQPSTGTTINIFDELLKAQSGAGLTANTDYDLVRLLPQVVAGHRLWAAAADELERFVSIERIDLMQDKATKTLWIRLFVATEDLARIEVGHGSLLVEARLTGWRQVRCAEKSSGGSAMVSYEQVGTVGYTSGPADKIQELVDTMKPHVWSVVLAVPPYRKYYLLPCPAAEHATILRPLVSIYAIMFYLGSITRYRPHHFDSILNGEYGPLVTGFIADQPRQFIYLLVSDILKQDVTRAAIV